MSARQFCSCPNPSNTSQSYPNQPYTHPYQHAVSPSTSPLSAESTNYIASPGSLGYQQSIPVGHPQTQNTMQYQQQSMVSTILPPNLSYVLTRVGLQWPAWCRLSTGDWQWSAGWANGKALPWMFLFLASKLNISQQNKGAIDPVTTTPLANTSSSNEKEVNSLPFITMV